MMGADRPTPEETSEDALPHEAVRFQHNSERQFARLLDFYGIEWQYEPRTFVLETDADGNPKQAFTPDFFLAEYELFVEVTTMNQKLVTKKNRKARRLREQHGVRVKVLYQRDYVHLLVKYGLEPPSPETERWGDPRPIDFGFDDDAPASESQSRSA